MAATLDVNLIGRLGYKIPPAQILLPSEGEKIRNVLLVPVFNG
jgi:hypothetical protein